MMPASSKRDAAAMAPLMPWILLFLSIGVTACGRKTEAERAALVRLADPSTMASFRTENLDLMEGEYYDTQRDSPPFITLDGTSDWYPFVPYLEAQPPQDLVFDETQEVPRTDPKLLLAEGCGAAFWIPLDHSTQGCLAVKCAGHFGEGFSCKIHQLHKKPDLPAPYVPGAVSKALAENELQACMMQCSEDRCSAIALLTPKPGMKGLLVLAVSMKGESLLEQVAGSVLSREQEILLRRRGVRYAHPMRETHALLNGIVLPSLMFFPGTSLSWKPLEIAPQTTLRASLHALGGFRHPVALTLQGRDERGADHEIFRRVFNEEPSDWIRVECDLGPFQGERLALHASCEWVGERGAADLLPPLVYLSSPILYTEGPAPQGRYNVILVSLDTLRRDRLHCYGYDKPVSPNLDRLAQDGVLCEHVYSHAPYTLPSHAALMTSLLPRAIGVQSVHDTIPRKVKPLAEILAEQEYATAAFTGDGYVSHEFGFNRGFDYFTEVDPLGDQYFDGVAQAGLRFGDETSGSFGRAMNWLGTMKDRPFFLFLHTFMVHAYLPPPELAKQYLAGCPSRLEPGPNCRGALADDMSPEDLAFFSALYDACIFTADRMIGDLRRRLEELGLAQRTLVIVTSDHGEEFLEHGRVQHTHTVYQELISVPLILEGPGMPSGMRIPTVLGHIDLLPTLLEILDIPCPEAVQGRSFLSLIRGGREKDRLVVSEVQIGKSTRNSCILDEGWKYIRGCTDPDMLYPSRAEEECYDIEEDPGETRNLADQHSEKEERLRKLLEGILESSDKFQEGLGENEEKSELPAELEEVLKQQGYL